LAHLEPPGSGSLEKFQLGQTQRPHDKPDMDEHTAENRAFAGKQTTMHIFPAKRTGMNLSRHEWGSCWDL
jgi:hypothetical protein